MDEDKKLIGLAEEKSFGIQLVSKLKQYVDKNAQGGGSNFLATNAQIRAIINGTYHNDFDDPDPNNNQLDDIEEADDDDIEAIINSLYT